MVVDLQCDYVIIASGALARCHCTQSASRQVNLSDGSLDWQVHHVKYMDTVYMYTYRKIL